ncbi:hypothetical protein HCH15_05595 [Corynebacterium testudinoris]|uniref:hypothetical protein n=1 Tax=Corynebacterium testudinoris TaxID=136857 RepID=UPI0006411927|nr:hypothetical protein [Corynebacterium testudinoris]MBX8995654.1 hypothetical protein [Corynebacterium testudinoris]
MSRKRRRVHRPSDAVDYDRTADSPSAFLGKEKPADEQREVILDPEAEESLVDEEFWREQRPPHYE